MAHKVELVVGMKLVIVMESGMHQRNALGILVAGPAARTAHGSNGLRGPGAVPLL
jgi:hypothetical protein